MRHLRGLPCGDPLPQFREAFPILAGALTLVLGGAGRWSLGRERAPTASAGTALR
jgi:hypothetical protein